MTSVTEGDPATAPIGEIEDTVGAERLITSGPAGPAGTGCSAQPTAQTHARQTSSTSPPRHRPQAWTSAQTAAWRPWERQSPDWRFSHCRGPAVSCVGNLIVLGPCLCPECA